MIDRAIEGFVFFIKTISSDYRNPNEPPEPEHGGRQERNRFKNIEWTPYESVHKKYLNLGELKDESGVVEPS